MPWSRATDPRKVRLSTFEREVLTMPTRTTGMFPNEYDATTDKVLRTIQGFGVSDLEIQADQFFLVDMLTLIGIEHGELSDTMELLDRAFIGLLYHRHMPFYSEEDGSIITPKRDPNDYAYTLAALANALVEQCGVPAEVVAKTAEDAAAETLVHLREPETLSPDDVKLHTHMIALNVIGMFVHRHLPSTHDHPMKGNQ